MLEVHLRHLQHISAVGQEHIPTLAVFGHVLVFALLEGFQLRRIIALNPAGLIQTERLPTALRTVFVLQTILDDLELQLPHRTDNLTPVELVDEQLRHTFVHQLVDTLGKLFLLHWVGILNVLEHLRRETRKPLEVKRLAFGQRIANLERTVIRQADNISRPSLIDSCLALRHELRRRRETHRLAMTYMQVRGIAYKLPGADFAESDT